jgi:hypothetical protein
MGKCRYPGCCRPASIRAGPWQRICEHHARMERDNALAIKSAIAAGWLVPLRRAEEGK